MSATCPYCYRGMIQPSPDKTGLWKCAPCRVTQDLLGYGVTITYIECEINGQEYSVRLDGKDMGTHITRWEQTSDGFYIGDTFVIAPGLLPITPSNIVRKIKLYMVFS